MCSLILHECHRFSRGEVYVKLELRKRGYVPGEPISGHIYIDNRSLKSVKYCFLRIVQRTICCSIRPEMHLKESYFDTAGIGAMWCLMYWVRWILGVGLPTHKVPAHTRFAFPINFYVPALLPNMRIPECIEADYTLRLSVGFKRGVAKYAFLQLSVSSYYWSASRKYSHCRHLLSSGLIPPRMLLNHSTRQSKSYHQLHRYISTAKVQQKVPNQHQPPMVNFWTEW